MYIIVSPPAAGGAGGRGAGAAADSTSSVIPGPSAPSVMVSARSTAASSMRRPPTNTPLPLWLRTIHRPSSNDTVACRRLTRPSSTRTSQSSSRPITNGRTRRNSRPSEVRTLSRGVTVAPVVTRSDLRRRRPRGRLERLDHVHQDRLVLRRRRVLHDAVEPVEIPVDANQVAQHLLGAFGADPRVLDQRPLAALAREQL